VLVEKYYPRLTYDFQTNKKIAEEVAIIPSKRLRNKIAGFATVDACIIYSNCFINRPSTFVSCVQTVDLVYVDSI
jgi:hypothetical protein